MPLTENDLIRIRQFIQKLEAGLLDGLTVFVTYHDSDLGSTPSNPTGDGTTGGWHTDSTDVVNWMSTKRAHHVTEGTWGDPMAIRGLKGDKGDTGAAGADDGGLSDDVPRLEDITFIGNVESGKVGWTTGKVIYGGSDYTITIQPVDDGNIDTFIYWDADDQNTIFKTIDDLATAIAAGNWVVCINDSGVAKPAAVHRVLLGGLIQANTITSAQITTGELITLAAQIKDAVITSAKIGLLEVKTANIENLNVLTGKLATNAATDKADGYTAAGVTISTGEVNLVSTGAFTNIGGRLLIVASAKLVYGSAGGAFTLRCYRGSTKIYEATDVYVSAYTPTVTVGFNVSDTPGAGADIYYFKAIKTNGGDCIAYNRSVYVQELKK